MRLWNTDTKEFEEFLDDNHIPHYAILSHTWGTQEASLRDVNESRANSQSFDNHEGYRKIDAAREVARTQGFDYIWIDTCCIDKSSSAELTEAINSMYEWYAKAKVCYVYFSDLKTTPVRNDDTGVNGDNETATIKTDELPLTDKTKEELAQCRWFQRGWTLQELIAPRDIIFFDADWKRIGTKDSLAEELSAITKINKDILLHRKPLSTVSVAQKMSWAAKRKTTRTEDTAYCLLGIFGVHLPFIYGEKHRAFRRLQEAILNSESSDLSIFAWTRQPSTELDPDRGESNGKKRKPREYCGVFATSTSDFSEAGKLAKRISPRRVELQPGNCGIKVLMQFFIQMTPENGGYRYLLPLDCYNEDNPTAVQCVRLRKYGWNGFIRENPCKIEEITTPLLAPITTGSRYLIPDTPQNDKMLISEAGKFDFIGRSRVHAMRLELGSGLWFQLMDVWPGHRFDGEDRVFYLNERSDNDSCMIRLRGGVLAPTGPERVDFEFMFCAVGWSSATASSPPDRKLEKKEPEPEPKPPALQCGVMDYRDYAAAFSEFRLDARGWDFHRAYFVERLAYHQMPRRSSIIMEVHGGIERAGVREAGSPPRQWVRVWFEASRAKDDDVCRNEFWIMKFHREYSDDRSSLEIKCNEHGGDLGWEMISDPGPGLGFEQIGVIGR